MMYYLYIFVNQVILLHVLKAYLNENNHFIINLLICRDCKNFRISDHQMQVVLCKVIFFIFLTLLISLLSLFIGTHYNILCAKRSPVIQSKDYLLSLDFHLYSIVGITTSMNKFKDLFSLVICRGLSNTMVFFLFSVTLKDNKMR